MIFLSEDIRLATANDASPYAVTIASYFDIMEYHYRVFCIDAFSGNEPKKSASYFLAV